MGKKNPDGDPTPQPNPEPQPQPQPGKGNGDGDPIDKFKEISLKWMFSKQKFKTKNNNTFINYVVLPFFKSVHMPNYSKPTWKQIFPGE